MKKKVFKHLSNQRGVTLIELLAVIVILGIIAAVAVPAVMSQIENSRVAVDSTNAKIISDAVERAIVNGDVKIPATGDTTTVSKTDLVPDYLKDLPTKDSGDAFTITVDDDGDVTVN